MLVRTSYVNDSRVQKEATSLARLGWRIKVIALWEPGLRRRETVNGVDVVRPPSRLLRNLSRRTGIGRKLGDARTDNEGVRQFARRWFYAVIASLDAAIFGIQALREVLRGSTPAVIHAHDLNTLPAAWLISRLTRARLVYDSHEIHQFSVSMQVRPRLWRAACRWVECACIRTADAVITVNEACAKAIARIHRVARPVVLHNTPALTEHHVQLRTGLREVIGAAPADPIAIYCGGLARNRGIEQSIRAVALAPGVKLVLLGYGEASYLDALRRLSARVGVQSRVFFVPPVGPLEVSAIMREANVSLVLIQDVGLSYHYSSPNKLFESLHAGLPIIGSDLPEIRRVLRRFGCGIAVPERDLQAIARAMREILGNRDRHAQLSRGARAAALQLNWDLEEAKLVGTYAGVLGLTPDLATAGAPAPRQPTTIL
jgi:glycosyltransferase involved in cell wall biosynthesis